MKKLLSIALISACVGVVGGGIATSAHAQDSQDNKFDGAYLTATAGLIFSDGATGGIYNFGGGYRKELGNRVVLGAEGTYSIITDNGESADGFTALGTIGIRTGNNGLLYSGFGYARFSNNGLSADAFMTSATYEHAVSDNVSLRLSADTYDLDDVSLRGGLTFRF